MNEMLYTSLLCIPVKLAPDSHTGIGALVLLRM